jgi:ABC-2 type transport system permease protein
VTSHDTTTRVEAMTFRRQVACFGGLLLRDICVLRNNIPDFLLRTLTQPALFVFVFAYLFPRIGQGIGGANSGAQSGFANVLVPGLVAVTAVFAGVSTVSLPLAIEFGATREIEDRIMAPLPVWAVAVEKLVFGALQSLVSAAFVVPLGMLISTDAIVVDIRQPGLLVAVVVLACWISGALGLTIGTVVAPQRMGLVFSVLVVPLTFLGCVYYPWSALAPVGWLQTAVLANPVVYMAEGLRATMTPDVPHLDPAVYLSVGAAFAVVLTAIGVRLFRRRVAI